MERIPRREVTRKRTGEVICHGTAGREDPESVSINPGIQSLAEEAVDAAVWDLFGRDHYERGGARGRCNG
ncbi:MAG: hypothetical protein JRH07_02760, partial [Deltaproteobacteria bacterium]|nr:hypothetical protein [Deltaproteobacteria bacterium]